MTPLEFILVAFGMSVGAGVFGSVLGLGGGIIVVPALTLLLHIDIRYAIGASIVAVIATSSGAGAAYVKQHLANIRVSMLLEPASTCGAMVGAFVAGKVQPQLLFVVFGLVLAYTASGMWRKSRGAGGDVQIDLLAERLSLGGTYFDKARNQEIAYKVRRTKSGLVASAFAGLVSGLLGVGGGVIKVPAMNVLMGMPLKVAAATSSFMIGVTAAASAGVYFYRGDIDPFITAPVAVGVVIGSQIGTRILHQIRNKSLRMAFTIVLVIVAVQMIWKGLR